MELFATSLQHILAELERIDLLVRLQVWRARQVQMADDGFQGLYISEREVDALLSGSAGLPQWKAVTGAPSLAEVEATITSLAADIARRKEESTARGIVLRLEELARLFQLTPFDTDALLVCLAPELDLRYERLYAYLQDDVTKKRPSVDLALNLLCPSFEAKLAARQRFAQGAPLLNYKLVELFDDPSHPNPPLLGKYLKGDERVVNYLLDSDELDARLLSYARFIQPQARLEDLVLPAEVKRRLGLLVRGAGAGAEGLFLYFQGPYGVGKQTAAEALCRELGVGLLVVDGERLMGVEGATFEVILRLAIREAALRRAALYWLGFDGLLAEDKRAWREALVRELEERPGLIFLAGEATWEPVDVLYSLLFMRIEFPRPVHADRVQLWQRSLNGARPGEADPSMALRLSSEQALRLSSEQALRPSSEQGSPMPAPSEPVRQALDLAALANKFRFSGGQIRDAAATARNLARWRDPQGGQVNMADLYAACRLQSNRKLAALARKIEPHYTWDDIVLPPDRLEQLREICNTVKHRARVYGEWGFDRKLSLGKGLNVLFAGPSGTGKTMAAEIMANELALDLYKIDLSGVVSKYIGETEKNLARIFAEAETSNAILFFDEADALFGKRSEVRDAHDRYANIEVAYLLQQMEAYEGIAILATNLRRNMDEAFARRITFSVNFPFPDQVLRREIWKRIWPAQVPMGETVNLGFLAEQFKLTGGNIKNVALAAAYLAASDGQVIQMEHLIRAVKREFQKMGKVCVEADFGPYFELVQSDREVDL